MSKVFLLLCLLFVPFVSATFFCYQESANVSTVCGGLSSGSYELHSPELFMFKVNYTVPITALNDSLWMVKHGDQLAYNQSIPSGCWNQGVLQFKIRSFFNDGTSTTYCFNGTGWQQLVSMSSPSCSGYNSLGHEAKLVDGDWSTWAKGNAVSGVTEWSNAFNGGGCANSSIFEDAMWWNLSFPHVTNFFRTSPLNVSLFESFVFRVNVTDNDSLISFVNLSVRYPNGSLVVLNTSIIGGLYESVSFVGVNGSWFVNVSTDEGFGGSYGFVVLDGWYVSPPDYVVLSAGTNLSSNLSFITGSLANLSFNGSCVLNSSFFNCSIASSFSVINSSTVSLLIDAFPATPTGVYYGNLSFVRDFDGRSYVLPLTVGVESSFGVPVLLNDDDWTTAVQSSASTSHVFVLFNNGSFPLSDCVVVFDQSLQYASFFSILPENFSVGVNDSTNFTLVFSNPPLGLYQGVMNVQCVASASNSINSLAVGNRPTVSLFSYPVYSGGGGGGGGGSTVVVVQGGANETLFTVETDAGAVESFLYMYPAQTRQQVIILRSGIITDQVLSIVCEGVFCANVKFDKSSVLLSGKQDALVFMNITVPQNTPYGSSFGFNVKIADNAQHSALLKYHIEVSRLSSWYSKFGVFCSAGDSCLWFMLGDFGVPKLVLYLLLLIPATLLVFVVVPDPKKKGNKAFRDVKPLLYIVVDLAVLLIASVLI